MNVNHYDTGKSFFDYSSGVAEFVEFLKNKYNYSEYDIAMLLYAIVSDEPTETTMNHLKEMGLFTTLDEFRNATRIFPGTFSKQIINKYTENHQELKIMPQSEIDEPDQLKVN